MTAARLALFLGASLAAAPASAAVIFAFEQTGPTIATGANYGPDGPTGVLTVGQLTLADSIIGTEYRLAANNTSRPPGAPVSPPPAGLLNIFFATFDRGAALVAGPAEFLTPNPQPGNGHYYDFLLAGTAGSLFPTGTVAFNNSVSDARLILDADGAVSGHYNTDRGGPCGTAGACSFSGHLTATPMPDAPIAVPEPVSLALFGLGLAGLFALRRRGAA